MKDAAPLNPRRVFRELSEKLPDDSILKVDSGSVPMLIAIPQKTSLKPRIQIR